ncbi:uncharacterized protein BDZ99DRAFT_570493 [Mytilinidion resinicola]|uniref:Apple domain-containing protein n=1 Tax=Mytilinidion resinicola TaxID=574789 RepID=A0A6A6YR64_9PEZI|nr:uncharacterized protein BDZ99DRAFT_570493 [Mytilinidion resinicola]KAF2811261.1 hypothetical protein BDZ99DRAFT_570493 [Mytilinidion resinicola]
MPKITFAQVIIFLAITSIYASASPTPHEFRDPTISCPASNGQTFTVGSSSFAISCSYDVSGGYMGMSWEANLSKCLSTCDVTQGCIVVSYTGGACYMKNRNNGGRSATGISSAQKVVGTPSSSSNMISTASAPSTSTATATPSPSTISCPASHGLVYISTNSIFKIECYTDHLGGDMGLSWEYSLQSCIETCDAMAECVDVSYRPGSPGPCYMKAAVLNTGTDPGIWGAPRIGTVSKASSMTTSSTYVTSLSSLGWTTISTSIPLSSPTVTSSSFPNSTSIASPNSASIAPSPPPPSPPPPPISCGLIQDADFETPGTTPDWHVLSTSTTNSSTGFYRTQPSTETSHKGPNVFYTLSSSPNDSVTWEPPSCNSLRESSTILPFGCGRIPLGCQWLLWMACKGG